MLLGVLLWSVMLSIVWYVVKVVINFKICLNLFYSLS